MEDTSLAGLDHHYGAMQGELEVVTPQSFLSSHSIVDTCAPRGDVPTTAAQDLLNLRVCLAKVDPLSMVKAKSQLLLEHKTGQNFSRKVGQIKHIEVGGNLVGSSFCKYLTFSCIIVWTLCCNCI
jgi:hypothetical protein